MALSLVREPSQPESEFWRRLYNCGRVGVAGTTDKDGCTLAIQLLEASLDRREVVVYVPGLRKVILYVPGLREVVVYVPGPQAVTNGRWQQSVAATAVSSHSRCKRVSTAVSTQQSQKGSGKQAVGKQAVGKQAVANRQW